MFGSILRNLFAGKYHNHKGVYLELEEIEELLAAKEDANHGHEVKAFRAVALTNQAIPPNTWTTVQLDALVWNYNSPGFNTSQYSHQPNTNYHKGIWHYSASLQVSGSPAFILGRIYEANGPQSIAFTGPGPVWVMFATDFPITVLTSKIELQVYAPTACNIVNVPDVTFLDGHMVGFLDLGSI